MTTEATWSPAISSSRRSRLDYGSSTDKAKREENEDYLELRETDNGLVALLADGMGGGAAGELFSKQAVQTALTVLQQATPLLSAREKIDQAFMAAIRCLHELRHSEPRYKQSGSTLVGALITESEGGMQVDVGNVGDSRAYLVDVHGKPHQLTRDHTHYQKLLRDKVPQEEAKADAQAGRLTHVLGNKLELDQIPEFWATKPFLPGETLVLCTDGIYKRVSDSEIASTVSKGSAQQAAKALVDLALAKNAQDNVTALVVRHNVPHRTPYSLSPLFTMGGIGILILLVVGIVSLRLAYGGSDGSNSGLPTGQPSNGQPGMVVAATVTSLPDATVAPVTPSAILALGQPTSTPAPTFTVTPSPTPTETPTVPPPPPPPPPTREPFIPNPPPYVPPAPTEPPAEQTVPADDPLPADPLPDDKPSADPSPDDKLPADPLPDDKLPVGPPPTG